MHAGSPALSSSVGGHYDRGTSGRKLLAQIDDAVGFGERVQQASLGGLGHSPHKIAVSKIAVQELAHQLSVGMLALKLEVDLPPIVRLPSNDGHQLRLSVLAIPAPENFLPRWRHDGWRKCTSRSADDRQPTKGGHHPQSPSHIVSPLHRHLSVIALNKGCLSRRSSDGGRFE
jgi:hypothetical protein